MARVEIYGTADKPVTLRLKTGDKIAQPNNGVYRYEMTQEEIDAYALNENITGSSNGNTRTVLFPFQQTDTLPTLSNLFVDQITTNSARINFITSRSVSAGVDWGLDDDEQPNIGAFSEPRTIHAVTITGLPSDTPIVARVQLPLQRFAVPAFSTAINNNGFTFAIVDDGATLTSSTHTVRWTETDSHPDDTYDLLIDDIDQGPAVDASTRQIVAGTFATDGRRHNNELHRNNNTIPSRRAVLPFHYFAVDERVTSGNFTFESQPVATVTGQSSISVRYEFTQNAKTWVELAAPASPFVRVSEVDNFNSRKHVRNIGDLRPSTTYTGIVYGQSSDGQLTQSNAFTITTDAAIDPTGLRQATFDAIQAGGLSFAVYDDPDPVLAALQWKAEFFRQNRDVVRYCAVDLQARTVTQLPTPTAPGNAVQLPAPSGGNDTTTIRNIIANGGDFVGTGQPYKLTRLIIDDDTRIWDMPYISGDNSPGIEIRGDDNLLVDCPATGTSESTYALFLRNTASRNHLINHGYTDVTSTSSQTGGDKSLIGVVANGAQDTYIAGGVYRNLINLRGDSHTHRANAFWFHGSNDDYELGAAEIWACECFNFESNGKLDDSEVLTVQGFIERGRSIAQSMVVGGCEGIAAGKRFIKCQSAGVLMLSNDVTWNSRPTEAGRSNGRLQLNIFSWQHDAWRDCIGRHNQIRILGPEQFGWVINLRPLNSGRRLEDLIWERNHVYIDRTPTSQFDHYYSRYRPYNSGSYTEVRVSIKDNVIEGPGGFNAGFHSYDPVNFNGMGVSDNTFANTGNVSDFRLETRQ